MKFSGLQWTAPLLAGLKHQCGGVCKQFFPFLPLPSSILNDYGGDRTSFDSRGVYLWEESGAVSFFQKEGSRKRTYAGSEFVANTDGQKHCRPSLAQRQSVQRIFSLVKRLGKPPSEVTGQGALNELRAKLGYDGQPSTLAQLQVDLVSLAISGSQPAPLEKILGDGASFPCELLNSKVLPPAVVDRLKADSSLKSPYFDPLLKNSRRTYADFIRKMFDSRVIEFRRQCREQVGLFCVWTKSGRQRLVVDARLTNLWFSDPEPVSLATGTSFGSIEVDDHGPIELAGVDISDAFYNIELPEVLRDLFGLLPLKAIEAGAGEIDGIPLKDNEKCFLFSKLFRWVGLMLCGCVSISMKPW